MDKQELIKKYITGRIINIIKNTDVEVSPTRGGWRVLVGNSSLEKLIQEEIGRMILDGTIPIKEGDIK